MGKKKIIFLGTGKNAASALKRLKNNSSLNIVSCAPRLNKIGEWFDNGLLANAAKDIKVKLISYLDINSDDFINSLKKENIDLIVNLGHRQLFKNKIIKSTNFGILNYHPGLLPFGRGPGALVGEIINGATEIGRTCHLVDEHFDRGIIINQEKLSIEANTTMTEASILLSRNIDRFIEESVIKTFQLGNKYSKRKSISFGRYFPNFSLGDNFIDWNSTALNIHNKVRSRIDETYSVIYTKENLKKILVSKTELAHEVNSYISVNGQVIDKSDKGVLVKTSDTAIWIREIINPNNNKKSIPSFKIGTCFQTINISDFIDLLLHFKSNTRS